MSTATRSEVQEGYFPHWKLKTTGVIMPEERLPWGQTIVSGLQHEVAMAGGPIIAPLIMAKPEPRCCAGRHHCSGCAVRHHRFDCHAIGRWLG